MKEENEEIHEKKEIEVVKGNPKDLKISDVKDNLYFEIDDKEKEKKTDIVIPENKNKE